MTRIIAGSARGRRLAVPPAGTRPTSDRVREALFSTLDSEFLAAGLAWGEVRVLDLFAGSGAFGLEALSRGAAGAVLVEKSRAAAAVIRANADAVGCPGAQVLVRDARQVAGLPPPDGGVDLCFADPPYDWAAADLTTVLSALHDSGWLSDDARVVVERPARDHASPLPDTWGESRRRAYGDTVLWYGQVSSDRAGDRRPYGADEVRGREGSL